MDSNNKLGLYIWVGYLNQGTATANNEPILKAAHHIVTFNRKMAEVRVIIKLYIIKWCGMFRLYLYDLEHKL